MQPAVPTVPQPKVPSSSRVWIFVDDSNIWIEGKKLAGEHRFGAGAEEDPRFRIDVGSLTTYVADNRNVVEGRLYGSEPPPVDTVWRSIREKGWKVCTHERSRWTNKEKKVDGQLIADATELACEEDGGTAIFITGDADARPAMEKFVDKVEKKGKKWQVEVYMWKHAVSGDLKKLAQEKPAIVQVNYIENFLNELSWVEYCFDIKRKDIPKERAIVIAGLRGMDMSRCDALEKILKVPFQYYRIDSADDHFVIILLDRDANKFDKAFTILQTTGESVLGIKKVLTLLAFEQQQANSSETLQLTHTRAGNPFASLQTVQDDPLVASAVMPAALAGELIESELSQEPEELALVSRHKPHVGPRYSSLCIFGFHCREGKRCANTHSAEEHEFFRRNEGRGNATYKTRACEFYRNGGCRRRVGECLFYHDDDDAICWICHKRGHCGEKCARYKRP